LASRSLLRNPSNWKSSPAFTELAQSSGGTSPGKDPAKANNPVYSPALLSFSAAVRTGRAGKGLLRGRPSSNWPKGRWRWAAISGHDTSRTNLSRREEEFIRVARSSTARRTTRKSQEVAAKRRSAGVQAQTVCGRAGPTTAGHALGAGQPTINTGKTRRLATWAQSNLQRSRNKTINWPGLDRDVRPKAQRFRNSSKDHFRHEMRPADGAGAPSPAVLGHELEKKNRLAMDHLRMVF